jgi:excisionase family DNA binding protein
MQTLALTPTAIPADADPWLRLRECAALVQAHEATLRREIARGRLRHARLGGRKSIRIRRSWLNAWLEASSTPVEA